MTIAPVSPWELAARAFEPPHRRWASPLDLAQELDPTIVRTPALNLINSALVDLANGYEDRLIVSMPPQEAKSSTAAYRFPAWLLSQVDPDLRIIMISYADSVARRWGADVKRDFESYNGDGGTVNLGVTLRADSRAAGRWQVEGRKGGMYCAGVAGSVTGRPADCLSGDSRIITECGIATIKDLHEHDGELPRALSFNHNSGAAEWRKIVATRAVENRPLVEVVTSAGRRIVCTPDHHLYVPGRGYVAAVDLLPGDGLLAADDRAGRVSALSDGVHEEPVNRVAREARDGHVLLTRVQTGGSQGVADVRGLRHDVHKTPLRGGGCQEERPDSVVLHESVLPQVRESRRRPPCSGAHGCDPNPRCGRPDNERDHPHGNGSAPLLLRVDQRAVGSREPSQAVRGVRGCPQEQGCGVSTLLPAGACLDVYDVVLRAMWRRLSDHAGRARQAGAGRSDQVLLPEDVLPPVDAGAPVGRVWALPQADEARRQAPPVLLRGVPDCGAGCETAGEGAPLPAVRRGVRAEVVAAGVLRPSLRGPSAFGANDRRGELPLQGRDVLRGVVPADAPADPGTGRRAVPCLQCSGPAGADRPQRRVPVEVELGDPSLERGPGGQPPGEPDHAVFAVSHAAPQVGYDTVSVVRRLHGAGDTVYDLQVDGNRNFFADQVLVHNCMIIDDPIKDLEQANSVVYRERFQRFWQGVAVPRLGPGAKAVLISTRWHEDDAAGWLLQTEGGRKDGGRWRVINIPAQCEDEATDPLGRKQGEYMISARGDRDWEGTKRSVGPYVWAALYMGRPAPAEGGLFKRLHWRYWTPASAIGPSPRIALGGTVHALDDAWRFATIDLANSTRTSADYTVIAAWARTLSGDLVLLDMVRAKIGGEQHFTHARPLIERWRLDTVFVEGSQYGTTLVREAVNSGVPITAVQAEADKFSRALPYSAWVASGRVWLPAGALWLDTWLGEHASFPAGRHDDMVDNGSIATSVSVRTWAPRSTLSPPIANASTDEVDFNTVPM